jgi:hypothetical protein
MLVRAEDEILGTHTPWSCFWPSSRMFVRSRLASKYPQVVDLAGRLDDPGQHQLPEHRVLTVGPAEPSTS